MRKANQLRRRTRKLTRAVGVDDDIVDWYGARLQAMNQHITTLQGGKDRIGFRSLPELFASHCDGSDSSSGDELSSAREIESMLPELVHHIATKMTREAEMCRKILVMGFQLDDDELRTMLSSQEASMIALYRGFSKFMLEDLATNKYTSHLSRTQLRKKSAKVAFEMIQVRPTSLTPFCAFYMMNREVEALQCS